MNSLKGRVALIDILIISHTHDTLKTLEELTASLSNHFIGKGVTVNTVNPGPTKTYHPSEEMDKAVLQRMPQGRWGEPDDAARLIGWLVSDEATWITGQAINSEGGFRRG
jgi:3-oxoacyl-[acyl-carrier protein] reductase